MNLKSNKGFSLIELMVTVGIIGIITMIAIPNFQKFQSKAKQANARSELSSIYGMQKAFWTEFGTYHSSLTTIGYTPDGVPVDSGTGCVKAFVAAEWPTRYYTVGFSEAGTPATLPAGTERCAADMSIRNTNTTTALAVSGTVLTDALFTAQAVGKVSDRGNNDIWTITQAKIITNTQIGY